MVSQLAKAVLRLQASMMQIQPLRRHTKRVCVARPKKTVFDGTQLKNSKACVVKQFYALVSTMPFRFCPSVARLTSLEAPAFLFPLDDACCLG